MARALLIPLIPIFILLLRSVIQDWQEQKEEQRRKKRGD